MTEHSPRPTPGATDETSDRRSFGQCNAPEKSFFSIAAGAIHSCGIRSDGIIVYWGACSGSQCNVPPAPPIIGWCNLQWPPTTTTAVSTPTELLFGRVWVSGVTPGDGQGAGVVAELGYGPTGSSPRTDSSWQWTPASYNLSVDGLAPGDLANDEYMATITPTASGQYSYTYRFSTDGGANWLYCDQDGASSWPEYNPAQAGVLTVP